MHHSRTAFACVAVAVGVAACSAPAKAPAPTVDFGPNGGTSVGMPGMTSGMPGMGPIASATTSTTPPVAGTAVDITNFAFAPANLTVKVGDTVTWTNKDEEPHTVVANDGSFHSPGLDANGRYSFTFTTPGSFDYICSIHPFMRGTVMVNR
ncbi:Plastocyanin [uncultured Mycobacterium sp.]|uniref:Plastocyanin n=1 Tax=uncultured Mycobacterium sp. TaxID=171292 RepID=A0A1Y5PES1_9MYCO|nr:Plastocyanin [uncultured Mycobacterium sp.]